MRSRIRAGWVAAGESGYHGYAFRHALNEAALDVWCFPADEVGEAVSERYMQTVEAELVFLIRQHGQWPMYQTEIHFYPSEERHREVARRVFAYYADAVGRSSAR
jgi:hypothetical protein